MATRGISLAERETIILKTDPSHPDNIEAEVARRVMQLHPDRRGNEDVKNDVRREVEKEVGLPTEYYVGPLTFDDKIELGDLDSSLTQSADGMRMTMRNTERAYTTVQRALKGWKNLLDQNGAQIPFETETVMHKGAPRAVASTKTVARMSREDVFALASEISTRNGMRAELEKKLESLSTQLAATGSESGDAQTKNADPKSGDGEGAESPAS